MQIWKFIVFAEYSRRLRVRIRKVVIANRWVYTQKDDRWYLAGAVGRRHTQITVLNFHKNRNLYFPVSRQSFEIGFTKKLSYIAGETTSLFEGGGFRVSHGNSLGFI